VVREWWGQGEEMTQALYAHMNNKRKKMLLTGVQCLRPIIFASNFIESTHFQDYLDQQLPLIIWFHTFYYD
jgi:hypothetical protein